MYHNDTKTTYTFITSALKDRCFHRCPSSSSSLAASDRIVLFAEPQARISESTIFRGILPYPLGVPILHGNVLIALSSGAPTDPSSLLSLPLGTWQSILSGWITTPVELDDQHSCCEFESNSSSAMRYQSKDKYARTLPMGKTEMRGGGVLKQSSDTTADDEDDYSHGDIDTDTDLPTETKIPSVHCKKHTTCGHTYNREDVDADDDIVSDIEDDVDIDDIVSEIDNEIEIDDEEEIEEDECEDDQEDEDDGDDEEFGSDGEDVV